jgi:hypothetical protein
MNCGLYLKLFICTKQNNMNQFQQSKKGGKQFNLENKEDNLNTQPFPYSYHPHQSSSQNDPSS